MYSLFCITMTKCKLNTNCFLCTKISPDELKTTILGELQNGFTTQNNLLDNVFCTLSSKSPDFGCVFLEISFE